MLRILVNTLKKIVPEEELEKRVLLRSYAVIAWVSFVFSGIATILFFATFDPKELSSTTTFPINLSATALYSVGFFLFWVLCFCCTTCTSILLSLPLNKRKKPLPDQNMDEPK